jgi:hypothetical protein
LAHFNAYMCIFFFLNMSRHFSIWKLHAFSFSCKPWKWTSRLRVD